MKKRYIPLFLISLSLLASCSGGQSAQPSTANTQPAMSTATPATTTPEQSQNPAIGEIQSCFDGLLPDVQTDVTLSKGRANIVVWSESLGTQVSDAQTSGVTPEGWDDLLTSFLSAASKAGEVAGENGVDRTTVYLTGDEMFSVIYATIIDGKETYNLFGDNQVKDDNPPTISKAEFDAIEVGMEYQEVFDLIGSKGEVISESGNGDDDLYTVMYQWDGEGTTGANANVMFQGGKVVNKAQFGLE